MAKRKSITEDIKPSWLNPIRASQAACRYNKGYAIIRIAVLVNKNDAVAWQDPELVKIHPKHLAEANVTPAFLATLLELGDNIGPKVDNNNSDS